MAAVFIFLVIKQNKTVVSEINEDLVEKDLFAQSTKVFFGAGLVVVLPAYGGYGTPLTGPELIGTVSVNFGGDARPSVSGGMGLLRKKTHFQ